MGNQELLEAVRRMRVAYGLDPEPLVPPTLDQMKAGEMHNAETLIEEALHDLGGTRKGKDPARRWYSKVTHDRDLPRFAITTVMADCWCPDAAEDLLTMAWGMPEWPGQYDRDLWLEAFWSLPGLPVCDQVDRHGVSCPHVAGPVQVWRASFTGHKRGLAWTTDRDTALWFASRGDMAGRGRKMHLWTTTITPDRVLAHLNGRGENEVVADVTGLRIREERIEETSPLHHGASVLA